MKASDFKINNLLLIGEKIVTVVDILCDSLNTDKYEGVSYDDIEPIPLTPEWLERAGFEKNGTLFEHPKSKLTGDNGIVYPAFFLNNRLKKWMDCHTRITIDYVHQLQNAWFVFAKEELEFNLDNL